MEKTIILILILTTIISCRKEEPIYDPYLINTYQQLLDNLVLDCPSDSSNYFFKGTIAGQDVCYFDGIDSRKIEFNKPIKYTTPSPVTIVGEIPNDARNGAFFSTRHKPTRQGEDYIIIDFPDYPLDLETTEYLDSIFAIEKHEIADNKKDEDTKFEVDLNMIDMKFPDVDGGMVFSISSAYGSQEGSYIQFNKVVKTIAQGEIYYYVDMSINCNLYHWPQHGKKGLWGKVENGNLRIKFKIEN